MADSETIDTIHNDGLMDEALDGQVWAKLSAHSCITACTGGCTT